MPRLSVPGFVGPANPEIASTLDVERTYDLYIQPVAPGTGRTPGALVGRPALRQFANFPLSPIRCLYEENGRAWVVGGAGYAEIFSNGTFGPVHVVANDSRIAYIVTNGSAGDQNMIVSGNLGYVNTLSTDAFVQITDPDFPAIVRQVEYMNAKGIVWVGGGSIQFQWSDLFDFTAWDALDVAQRSIAPDNINGILRLQETLLIFGRRTMEPWYDVGQGNTVFAPTGSVLVEQGLYATATLLRLDNTAYWLGVNQEGQLSVYRLNNLTPERISTDAVDYSLAQADTPTDAVAMAFQVHGRRYYLLNLPRQNDSSWIFDVALNRWYQWGHWDTTTCMRLPFRGWVHCLAFEKCLIGDRLSGAIYELRTDVYEDDLTVAA